MRSSKVEPLRKALENASSFLDRIEQVGIVSESQRATLRSWALCACERRSFGHANGQPYGAYRHIAFDVPIEHDGDGYARLRVLFLGDDAIAADHAHGGPESSTRSGARSGSRA